MKYLKFIIFIIMILGLFSCNTNQKKPPMAKQGILDLRNWDFEKDGNVRLDGDWEFYWHEFLSSKDFDTVQQKHYIKVPKPWNDYKWGKEELGYEGSATYRLRILVNDKIKDFGLKFPDQGTAFELYLNDSLVGKNGKIGRSRETSEPQYRPLLIPFERKGDTITLVCKVSNYDFHFGGIYFIPEIGNGDAIIKSKHSSIILDYCITVLLLSFFLILIIFYLLRPKEKASLVFSFVCLTTAFRTITTGEKIIMEIFPNINWELLIKIEGLSWLNFAILFWLYLRILFKNEYSIKILILITIFYSIMDLITIFTPANVNTFFITPAQFVAGCLSLYLLYIAVLAVYRKREGAIILFLSFLVIPFSSVNNILYYNGIIHFIFPIQAAIVLLSFSQIILLSLRFSRTFNRVENFANELKIKVEERTKEVVDKSKIIELEKEKSDTLLLNVLPESIANRLKSGETTIADHFEDASVIFIDIADFTKLSAKSSPQMMVKMLNEIFTIFDKIAAKYGLEKIKTIGDCYMAAAGIPVPRKDHAEAIAMMALDVMETMKEYRSEDGHEIKFRIGLDCGPIVAGVIGEQKFIYDLWGDMVNTASRMETNGIIGKIQCTERFKEKLSVDGSRLSEKGDGIVLQATDNRQLATRFEERGEIEIKGKGKMRTWFLIYN